MRGGSFARKDPSGSARSEGWEWGAAGGVPRFSDPALDRLRVAGGRGVGAAQPARDRAPILRDLSDAYMKLRDVGLTPLVVDRRRESLADRLGVRRSVAETSGRRAPLRGSRSRRMATPDPADRLGVSRASQEWKIKGLLDRAQEPVVVDWSVEH